MRPSADDSIVVDGLDITYVNLAGEGRDITSIGNLMTDVKVHIKLVHI